MAKLRFIADNGVTLPKYFQWSDAISVFCRSENFAFLADRFGFLNQFSKINAASITKYEFPNGNFTKTFYDIMIKRATEIYNICSSLYKKCYIMWSGGCDSTAMIAAFIECGINLSFIHILHTKSSVIEYKEFYEFLIKNNINMELVNASQLFKKAQMYAEQGHIVLTGFPADQLFGSIVGQTYPKDTSKTHWTEFLNEDIANQQYEAAFQHYNIPIKTVAEFLWFNNFVLKWDYVCYAGLWMNNSHHSNIIPFYNTYDFEAWSVANYDILHKYDQKSYKKYKIQMKDFIYKVTKLKSSYLLKKIPSLEKAYNIDNVDTSSNIISISALDDENNIIIMSERLYNKDNISLKYGILCASIMRKYLK